MAVLPYTSRAVRVGWENRGRDTPLVPGRLVVTVADTVHDYLVVEHDLVPKLGMVPSRGYTVGGWCWNDILSIVRDYTEPASYMWPWTALRAKNAAENHDGLTLVLWEEVKHLCEPETVDGHPEWGEVAY